MSEYIRGLGCKCAAHDESECGCADVDWRSSREVELERQLAEAHEQIEQMKCCDNCEHWDNWRYCADMECDLPTHSKWQLKGIK